MPTKKESNVIDRVKNNRKSSELNPDPSDLFDHVAGMVVTEKQRYEEASLGIRRTIQRAYKNYLMIFDEPTDPYTKRRKIFTPLTHNIVDAVSKPIRVENRSIKVKPVNNKSKGAARILNMVLPYFLQETDFESLMEDVAHRCAWLGTQVTVQDWMYEESEIEDGIEPTNQILEGYAFEDKRTGKIKKVKTDRPRVRLVNLLDLYLDPTSESLSSAVKSSSVILRSVVPLSDIQSNPAYDDDVKSNLSGRTYSTYDNYNADSLNEDSLAGFMNGEAKQKNSASFTKGSVPFVELYERYGRIPKSWITGDEKDCLLMVPGVISCVSDNGGGTMQTLCVRSSPFGDYGPFEECRFNHVPNRWYAEGLGERLIPLQTHHNEIVNNRRNNELVVQHRMFVYRKGKVDPSQFFARPGGGIAVQNMDDIQALPMQDIASSSFNEDSMIMSQAQAVAGIALTPVGKKMTATEASIAQANANLSYSELQGRLEQYIERMMNKHLLPLIRKYFTDKRVIPVDIPAEELKMLDSYNGYAPMDEELLDKTRFLFIDTPKVFDGDFTVTVDLEEAGTGRTAQIQALTNAMSMASKIQNSGFNMQMAFKKILELSGIVDDRLFEDSKQITPTGVTGTNLPPVQEPQMQTPAVGPA